MKKYFILLIVFFCLISSVSANTINDTDSNNCLQEPLNNDVVGTDFSGSPSHSINSNVSNELNSIDYDLSRSSNEFDYDSYLSSDNDNLLSFDC